MAKKRARKPRTQPKPKARGGRTRAGRTGSKARPRARTKARAKARPRKATKADRRPAATKRRSRSARAAAAAAEPRRAVRLDRARRQLIDADEPIPGPPSSLNLDQGASAAKSGRQEFQESLDEHTETSPALTAGDVDAAWQDAYAVGDEAPGGDNPTPDQDRVDDIGRALGVEYEDNEELKGAAKLEKRDRNRWELDPASAEDYKDRDDE